MYHFIVEIFTSINHMTLFFMILAETLTHQSILATTLHLSKSMLTKSVSYLPLKFGDFIYHLLNHRLKKKGKSSYGPKLKFQKPNGPKK
jgi:hypothetical protein